MDTRNIKLLAFDLDGTITQHKSPLSASNRELLDLLSKKYRLLIVGAGMCDRIFEQMRDYPIDIIGNYGMQYAKCTPDGSLHIIENIQVPCDRVSVEHRVTALRKKYGFENYSGESVEYHTSLERAWNITPLGALHFRFLGRKQNWRTNWPLIQIEKNGALSIRMCARHFRITLFLLGVPQVLICRPLRIINTMP